MRQLALCWRACFHPLIPIPAVLRLVFAASDASPVQTHPNELRSVGLALSVSVGEGECLKSEYKSSRVYLAMYHLTQSVGTSKTSHMEAACLAPSLETAT